MLLTKNIFMDLNNINMNMMIFINNNGINLYLVYNIMEKCKITNKWIMIKLSNKLIILK